MIFWTAQEPKHLAVKKSELHLDCSDRIEILMFIIYILEQSTTIDKEILYAGHCIDNSECEYFVSQRTQTISRNLKCGTEMLSCIITGVQ